MRGKAPASTSAPGVPGEGGGSAQGKGQARRRGVRSRTREGSQVKTGRNRGDQRRHSTHVPILVVRTVRAVVRGEVEREVEPIAGFAQVSEFAIAAAAALSTSLKHISRGRTTP